MEKPPKLFELVAVDAVPSRGEIRVSARLAIVKPRSSELPPLRLSLSCLVCGGELEENNPAPACRRCA